jgi:hypothetical protein
MELHAPGGPVRSLKDFLVHIGVVTLGILIALGLEQLVEAHHRSHLAKVALDGFRKELDYNEGQINQVLAGVAKLQAKIETAIGNLSTAPAPGAAEPPLDYPGIFLNVVSTASWDTAVATQALNELPFETVTRYAQAYGTVRLFGDAERQSLGAWEDLRRFGTNPAALTQDQRAALILELRRYGNVLTIVEFAGRGALRSCADALK